MDQNTTFTDREAGQILVGICIPPCPAILTKLMKEMRANEPNFIRISQLISEDTSLSAAMLKMINSAFYGLRTKATSVQQAVHLLGLSQVSKLVTGVLLRDTFTKGSSARMDAYWESSSTIAQISAYLAGQFDGFKRDEAYTFALFRDCGMLAMMNSYKDYKPILPGELAPDNLGIIAYEDNLHKINHARVGCNLAKMWLLPAEIYKPIFWHHDYIALQQGHADITVADAKHIALALVAEWIYVTHTTTVESSEWRNGSSFALRALDTTLDELDSVAATTLQESGIF